MKNAFEILLRIADNWENIGTMLLVPGLEDIRTKEREASQNCLRAMLVKWLTLVDPPPTWKALADAVEKFDPAKAKEIRDKYLCRG